MLFYLFKISKIKLDSAQNVTVSKDQVHIWHCCTWQFLLFLHRATIVSLTVFTPRASNGTILELCSFRYSKFQKSNWILLKMSLFRKIKCTFEHCCKWQFLLFLHRATIVSLTVLLQEPQMGPYWSYALLFIQNFKNQTGFCSYVTVFAGSSAHWTLLYMTTSTFNTWRYNSVIDSFAPRASNGTILE
jgi:hypothetical protein